MLAPGARAGSCGGPTPCRCGDTVTADYELSDDLGPCPGHGLILRTAVLLDCRGHRITGLGDGSEQYGVHLDGKPGAEVTGARVANCHVSGFLRGIRLRAARATAITGNVLTRNGDFTRHVGYGIDLAGGSTDNLLEHNRVEQNADEGVHIGTGGHGNRLIGNVIGDNHREGLYVLGAHRGLFRQNTLGGRGGNSLYLKDSRGNRFEDNRFIARPARVIGDSRDNVFAGNVFVDTGIHFQDYKGRGRPRGNQVRGGSIGGGAYCVRFTNSGGNVVADVALGDCRTAVEADSPQEPTENTLIGFDKGSLDLDAHSTIHLAWRVEVRVLDKTGRPVAGARVTARMGGDVPAFDATTDEAGAIPPQVVTGLTRSGKRVSAAPPVTISVRRAGLPGHTRELPLAKHVELVITLPDP